MINQSFKAFVLDQLAALPGVRAKAMFGGQGLYQGERFFGILMAGRLYFKTNDQTRSQYLRRGMSPFIYGKARQTTIIKYYEVPPEILEDRESHPGDRRVIRTQIAFKAVARSFSDGNPHVPMPSLAPRADGSG
jgi:DNA transformation protein and related proteins